MPNDALQTTPLPPEDALKHAISTLNIEASRLRLKAADWRRDDPATPHSAVMENDAYELESVRDYLEQFVTRDTGGM